MSEAAQLSAGGLRGELSLDVDMSRHTSWRAGGVAQRMYRPADLADLQTYLQQLPQDEPLLAVGLGSNLLVRDGGFRGTVLLLLGALTELHMQSENLIYVQAGIPGAKLARFAAGNNLCGAEFFVGIPGTLGGMLAMNAGCYGSETWQKVERVQVLTRSGELLERTPNEYEIGYRHVALRQASEEFFVGAWLRLQQGEVESARQAIKLLMEKRSASQPLQQPNAGSVFRNPLGEHAAKLIEGCGLKGQRIGDAQVSEKHANFIVNLGNASATDIERLIGEVRSTVLDKTGFDLQAEVRIVGDAA
ncbi:MAG: UDP-N-acetylmuramate dehydrogenase [Pseudomonadota bacterium]